MRYAVIAIAAIIALAIIEHLFHSTDTKGNFRDRIHGLIENIGDILLFAPVRAWHLLQASALQLLGVHKWYYGRKLLKAIHGGKIPPEELEKIEPQAFKAIKNLIIRRKSAKQ
jgi:hypothetical protein